MRTSRMVLRLTAYCLVGTLVASLFGLDQRPSEAHTASTYYPVRWNINVLDWRFGDLQFLNTAAVRNRVREGFDEWEASDPANFGWDEEPQNRNLQFTKNTECAINDPDDLWVIARTWDGPGGTVATVRRCPTDNPLNHLVLVLDTNEAWWTSSSSNVPSDQLDLLSVTTHEGGHATAWWGHFGSSMCNGTIFDETMCPVIEFGDAHWRTLRGHDVHTWQAAY